VPAWPRRGSPRQDIGTAGNAKGRDGARPSTVAS
jgi:hypothetical protein